MPVCKFSLRSTSFCHPYTCQQLSPASGYRDMAWLTLDFSFNELIKCLTSSAYIQAGYRPPTCSVMTFLISYANILWNQNHKPPTPPHPKKKKKQFIFCHSLHHLLAQAGTAILVSSIHWVCCCYYQLGWQNNQPVPVSLVSSPSAVVEGRGSLLEEGRIDWMGDGDGADRKWIHSFVLTLNAHISSPGG